MNDSEEKVLTISPPRSLVAAATGTLAILALFLFVQAVTVAQNLGNNDYPARTITVQGEGKANAVPDVATIAYSVTESASTVAAAQTAATAKSDAALAALKELGIEDKDVKTLSYNVSPKYDSPSCPNGYCPSTSPRIVGYQVSQGIQVKVRDTAKAGDVLQKLGTLEVQNISGPNFMVDEDGPVQEEARAEAIANAREKAQKLAGELGVRLGKVVSYSDNGYYPYPMYDSYMAKGSGMMEAASAPSIPVGQNETNVSVSVTFEIR